jgi:geranylgeranyl diphosphate synthase type II
MHSFQQLSKAFSEKFDTKHFPAFPASLYEPNEYFLGLGGKRIRPVMCLMGNELFGEIIPDAYHVSTAIELFHNFSLVHDDIMDNAPLRRGMQTMHEKYNLSTALLAGDVMLVVAYDYLNKIHATNLNRILKLFNRTARQVCEGQQLDMDYEKNAEVNLKDYIHMIELKTSVLLAGALQMGAVLGGAGEGNQEHLFEFGKNLGIAFQIQDDYLDAFGDPEKFGKQQGGDIKANKKTFLVIKAMELAKGNDKAALQQLMESSAPDKVERVQEIFRSTGVDTWARSLQDEYITTAFTHLEDIAVLSARKQPLQALADFLVKREY